MRRIIKTKTQTLCLYLLLEPDGAPQNVRGQAINSTSISVSWQPVQSEKQNGIITKYTIRYQSQTENHNGEEVTGADVRSVNITGLREYVFYDITVFASTVKGDGPHSTPVLTVRTLEDSKSDPSSIEY